MANPIDDLLPNDRDHARLIAAHVIELMRTERPVVQEWLSQEEAALYLGMSERLLEGRRHTETGPAYSKHGPRVVRYHRDSLDAWMASGHVPR